MFKTWFQSAELLIGVHCGYCHKLKYGYCGRHARLDFITLCKKSEICKLNYFRLSFMQEPRG